ncbi:hypothetical protein HID58_044068 [Brassica napus]|uniref:Neprosin domain-containing protein n=1 Tax=Brassica napus TaxID=3708 RepID=A0ABQ8BIA8_BRANA|nr:hypothetical protein HID58_044068 [Brassica napus]
MSGDKIHATVKQELMSQWSYSCYGGVATNWRTRTWRDLFLSDYQDGHIVEAVTLNNYYRTSPAKVDLCVLRSWSIVWGEGGFNYVTNLEGGSQILFDHDMAEIQNFKSKIPTTEL